MILNCILILGIFAKNALEVRCCDIDDDRVASIEVESVRNERELLARYVLLYERMID
jgi:hypothetical protein